MRGSFCPRRKQKPEDFIASVKRLFSVFGIKLIVRCYKSLHHDDSDKIIENLRAKSKKNKEEGKMPISGVYVFLLDDNSCNRCLKVGKVGNIAEARWYSQHYTLNKTSSTLPRSILEKSDIFQNIFSKNKEEEKAGEYFIGILKEIQEKISKRTQKTHTGSDIEDDKKYDPDGKIREWVEKNTCRLEFIFNEEEASKPTYAENFLEGYLHWLLKPCYEEG